MVKIMIADDQQLIRESLKIILDSDPSFEVVKVVGSGQEVLDSLSHKSGFSLLIAAVCPASCYEPSFRDEEDSELPASGLPTMVR